MNPLSEADVSKTPVMEVVAMTVAVQRRVSFAKRLRAALELLKQAPGYCGHAYGPCAEELDTFYLLVRWHSLEAHVRDFRNSPACAEWRSHLVDDVLGQPKVHHFHMMDEAWLNDNGLKSTSNNSK